MADTRIQKEVERWICENYLPEQFGQQFAEKDMPLKWKGKFKFDAVSQDNKIVVNISSSLGRTITGKSASGQIHKIKSDTLYLLNVKGPSVRIQLFTEENMYNKFQQEVQSGRYPDSDIIKIMYVRLPKDLQIKVKKVRKKASEKVTPGIRRMPK